jgi:polygalacturonase
MAARTPCAERDSVFAVRSHAAAGDGVSLDTEPINEAVQARAAAGGEQVRFRSGRYLCATIHLKSHVTLALEPGAMLVGASDPNLYEQPESPAHLPTARWGRWHHTLIPVDGQEDVAIIGGGVIDGNEVFDATGEEQMRGPHTFVFLNCRDVTVRDVSFVDSANYANPRCGSIPAL